MKILRPGNIPFEYVKFNCQYCDCEFIAHKETEVEHIYDQMDGDSYYVICPCCGKDFIFLPILTDFYVMKMGTRRRKNIIKLEKFNLDNLKRF